MVVFCIIWILWIFCKVFWKNMDAVPVLRQSINQKRLRMFFLKLRRQSVEVMKNISDFWNTARRHIYSSVHTLHHQNCKYFWKFLVKPFQPTSVSLEDKKSWQGSGNLSDSCWLGLLHIFSSIWQSLQSSSPTFPYSALLITPSQPLLFPSYYPLLPTHPDLTPTQDSSPPIPPSLLPLIEALLTHHIACMQPRTDIFWIC